MWKVIPLPSLRSVRKWFCAGISRPKLPTEEWPKRWRPRSMVLYFNELLTYSCQNVFVQVLILRSSLWSGLPKWYLTGGGKNLKNQTKSSGYLNNILKKFTKKKLTFAAYERRASAGCYFSKSLLFWACKKIQNLKKILTFAQYDKIGGKGSRAGYSCRDVQFLLKN